MKLNQGRLSAKLTGKRSKDWPKVRRAWLKKHPTCAACGGKKALNVHHKKPFHLHPDLELCQENFITLCEAVGHCCHFAFGHAYNWSLFVPEVVEDATAHLARVVEVHSAGKKKAA